MDGETAAAAKKAVATVASSTASPSRYEAQKRRDWDTFVKYLKNREPPLCQCRCSGAHVIEFLKYLDQFAKATLNADDGGGGRGSGVAALVVSATMV
ncbi:hypothetical protein YC2023_122960 [Brassica napus]